MDFQPQASSAYQQGAALGADPLELVVLLYDRVIQDVHGAISAMLRDDVEARTGCVSHALLILQQLQGTLDFERGGSVARQLQKYYDHIRAKLLEAQIRQSSELMTQQLHSLGEIRDCWVQTLRQQQPAPAPEAMTIALASTETPQQPEIPRSAWQA